jgi:hypothetical protein
MAKFGEKIDPKQMTKGNPPLLFQLQPQGFIKLEARQDIKDWEDNLKVFYGIDHRDLGKIVPLDTCSGGCLDDCGGVARE